MQSIVIDSRPSKLKKVWQKFKEPKVYIPSFLLVVLLGVVASTLNRYAIANRSETKTVKSSIFGLKREEKTMISPLDGIRYSETDANRHTLGVMIENHPDSRPQFGLSDASVVYEAQAEGGITRFLAIFGPKLPEKVGPVRSARTYYLDECLEYDCFYAHVGGNRDALDLIPTLKIKDLDQFRYGVKQYDNAYYRVPKKGIATEHTMFANPAKLYKIAEANKWQMTDNFPVISFKDDLRKADRPTAQQVDIEISSKQFNTSWSYDPATNSYARAMGGVAHNDAGSGRQIVSKVVLVQEVPSKPTVTRINEQGLILSTVGTGKAQIFQDGKMIEGTWKKASQKERTIFYDDRGREIRYNAGQRWITMVDPGSKVTVTGPVDDATAMSPSPSLSVSPTISPSAESKTNKPEKPKKNKEDKKQ